MKKNDKLYKISDKSLEMINILSMEDLIYGILSKIGEDPSREGLLRTPSRVAKAYEFLTKGYHDNLKKILNEAVFTEKYNQMVVIKDIDFFSMCEHHMLPFYGKCHIAYIPNEKIVGLSKIPRIVEIFARRLQVQERMTQEIAETINTVLKPQGVAVVVEGRHMCMMMRGVEKQNSIATTSAVIGEFHEDAGTRQEFFNLIKNRII
jgi:GTP cyclohydrolase IA